MKRTKYECRLTRLGKGQKAECGVYKCICGKVKECCDRSVKHGKINSCGCLRKELRAEKCRMRNTSHGWHGTKTYRSWVSIKARCYKPTHKSFHRYGGRGIKVCERWTGPNGFVNFLADMGPRPKGSYSLDRYPNNDGDYEPANCRWATKLQQSRGTCTNRKLMCFGRVQCLEEWAEEFGIKAGTIAARIRRGWDVQRAITEPACRTC